MQRNAPNYLKEIKMVQPTSLYAAPAEKPKIKHKSFPSQPKVFNIPNKSQFLYPSHLKEIKIQRESKHRKPKRECRGSMKNVMLNEQRPKSRCNASHFLPNFVYLHVIPENHTTKESELANKGFRRAVCTVDRGCHAFWVNFWNARSAIKMS